LVSTYSKEYEILVTRRNILGEKAFLIGDQISEPMKPIKPPLPSGDKRWKIVDAKMRRLGYAGYALIETLHTVQESFGYLDEEALAFVARALRVPPSRVYGVATFYNFFSLKPQGAHTCIVCLGTACYVKGADKVLAAIEEYSGIEAGETTLDKQLSLLTARCIGACAIGPAVIYDGIVTGHRTPENAVEKLKGIVRHAA
jgi:bidirectional [NiFe] hydrogenase diaphorase subunit